MGHHGHVDPDPRFSLANERTFLAWIRTAVALIAGGIALEALRVDLSSGMRTALAVTLVATGGAMTVAALRRWHQVDRAIQDNRPAPPFPGLWVLSLVMVLVSVALIVGLVT